MEQRKNISLKKFDRKKDFESKKLKKPPETTDITRIANNRIEFGFFFLLFLFKSTAIRKISGVRRQRIRKLNTFAVLDSFYLCMCLKSFDFNKIAIILCHERVIEFEK